MIDVTSADEDAYPTIIDVVADVDFGLWKVLVTGESSAAAWQEHFHNLARDC